MSDGSIRLSPAQTLRVVSSTPERLEIESTWATGGTAPPTHWHPRQHEHFDVLEGELTVGIDGREPTVFRAGDTVDVPPRTAHRMWNAGTVPCRAAWVVEPALRTEEMFRAIDRGPRLVAAARLVTAFRAEFRFGSPRS